MNTQIHTNTHTYSTHKYRDIHTKTHRHNKHTHKHAHKHTDIQAHTQATAGELWVAPQCSETVCHPTESVWDTKLVLL